MYAQYFAWALFFAAYGLCFWSYHRWLADKRIAQKIRQVKFGTISGGFAVAGIICLAVLPPVAEIVFRIWFEWKMFEGNGFIALGLVWVISALPGIVSSRRILKAAGIDPDAES